MTSSAFPRRSFVSRRLASAAAQARWSADALVLCDLSVLPRWGLKGRDAFPWLTQQGALAPSGDNRARAQADGSLIARLAPGEALILSAWPDGRASLAEAIEGLPPEGRGACYPMLRRDSHSWFVLTGTDAPWTFAKLCGVDLAADQFPDGSIAQTSVARLTAIVIRHNLAGTIGFSLLAESASAEYLWDCLLDAMAEFSGRVASIESLPGVAWR